MPCKAVILEKELSRSQVHNSKQHYPGRDCSAEGQDVTNFLSGKQVIQPHIFVIHDILEMVLLFPQSQLTY